MSSGACRRIESDVAYASLPNLTMAYGRENCCRAEYNGTFSSVNSNPVIARALDGYWSVSVPSGAPRNVYSWYAFYAKSQSSRFTLRHFFDHGDASGGKGECARRRASRQEFATVRYVGQFRFCLPMIHDEPKCAVSGLAFYDFDLFR